MSKLLFTLSAIAFILLGTGLLAPPIPAAAQDGTLVPGTPIEGTLSGGPATYTLNLSAGQLVMITLESEIFDPILIVNDTSGNQLARNDDGPSGRGSLLAFISPTDSAYAVVVDGWDLNGAYTLTASTPTANQVEVGGSVSLSPDGAAPLYIIFTGTAGMVVNVAATSQAEEDTKLKLYGPDIQMLAENDDDGPGRNPSLRRVQIATDGPYLLEVTSVFGEDLTANVDVTVESAELLILSETPQSVSLSPEGLGMEIFDFEAAAGTTYRFIVTMANGNGVNLSLENTGDFFSPTLDAGSGARVAWDYVAPVSGNLRLIVHPTFFGDGDDYQISLEVVQ
jgi:hypothetical protein